MANIQLITGTNPLQLLDYCLEELATVSKDLKTRLSERSFLLVPEALKADAERRYLTNFDVNGLMLAEVVSFKRFAFRIFSIAGGLVENQLTPLGKTMLIQKIISEHQGEFKRFQRFIGKPGYTDELKRVLTDFKRFDMTKEILESLIEVAPPSLTKDKLQDFYTLKTLYEDAIENMKVLDQDDDLDRLAELLSSDNEDLEFLRNARIWISGFADIRIFSQQELKIIEALAGKVKQLTITVCANPESTSSVQKELFTPGNQAFAQLQQKLPEHQVVHLESQMSTSQTTLQEALVTGHLVDENQNQEAVHEHLQTEKEPSIQLIKADEPRQEWAYIAGEIKRLIKENHYQKRDIGIVYTDENTEQQFAKSMMRDFGISTFITERIPVKQSPLYHYLENFLRLSIGNTKTQDILSFFRTDFSFASEQEVDKFENICLEYGFRYQNELIDDKYQERIKGDYHKTWFIKFKEKHVIPLFTALQKMKACKTAEQRADFVITFFSRKELISGIEQKIETLRGWGEDDIALSLARTFDIILQATEEIKSVFANQNMPQKTFVDILLGALSGQIPSSIPVGIDNVRIGQARTMMYYDCKVLFITGMTQKTFPIQIGTDGFLQPVELDWIEAKSERNLPRYKENQMLAGQVSAAVLLGAAKERLYLSTPTLDHESWTNLFSLLQKEMNQQTSMAKSFRISNVTLGHMISPDQRWLTEHRASCYLKANQKKDNLDGYKRTIIDVTEKSEQKDFLPQELTYWQIAIKDFEETRQNTLAKDPLEQIRPIIFLSKSYNHLQLKSKKYFSASALEHYQSCPYRYFASYSIGMKERPLFAADQKNRGTLMHAMMETAFSDLYEKIKETQSLDEKQQVFSEWKEQLLNQDFYDKLYHQSAIESGLWSYQDKVIAAHLGERMKRSIRAAMIYNAKQIADQDFIPQFFEWTFPKRKEDSELNEFKDLPLSNDEYQWNLRGIIDRVDINNKFYRLYDYKTGNKNIDFNKIYHGLDMQLGLYQKVWQINHHGQEIDAMGYLKFSNQLEDSKKNKDRLFALKEDLITRLEKQNLSSELRATKEEIDAVGEYAYEQAKQVVERIKQGDISPIPKAMKIEDVSCQYCLHAEMCRKDQRTIAQRADIKEPVRDEFEQKNKSTDKVDIVIRNLKKEEILKKIVEEQEGKH